MLQLTIKSQNSPSTCKLCRSSAGSHPSLRTGSIHSCATRSLSGRTFSTVNHSAVRPARHILIHSVRRRPNIISNEENCHFQASNQHPFLRNISKGEKIQLSTSHSESSPDEYFQNLILHSLSPYPPHHAFYPSSLPRLSLPLGTSKRLPHLIRVVPFFTPFYCGIRRPRIAFSLARVFSAAKHLFPPSAITSSQ